MCCYRSYCHPIVKVMKTERMGNASRSSRQTWSRSLTRMAKDDIRTNPVLLPQLLGGPRVLHSRIRVNADLVVHSQQLLPLKLQYLWFLGNWFVLVRKTLFSARDTFQTMLPHGFSLTVTLRQTRATLARQEQALSGHARKARHPLSPFLATPLCQH